MYSDTHRAESATDIQNVIARALGFTREELSENRQERIAKTQIKRLMERASEPLKKAFGALLAGVVLVMGVHFFASNLPGYAAIYVNNKLLGSSVLIGAGAVIVVLTGFFKSIKTAAGILLDVREAQVLCLEGRVTTSKGLAENNGIADHPEASNESYFYVVEDEYLAVSFEAFEAMQPYTGSPFKVYVAPRSKFLLSMEFMILRASPKKLSIWK